MFAAPISARMRKMNTCSCFWTMAGLYFASLYQFRGFPRCRRCPRLLRRAGGADKHTFKAGLQASPGG